VGQLGGKVAGFEIRNRFERASRSADEFVRDLQRPSDRAGLPDPFDQGVDLGVVGNLT
jgi:hypothetical protein